MLGRETLRTFGHKVHVRTVAQDFASGPDRIAQPLYTADAACSQRGAIHDEGIELHFAFAIEKAAATGIESLIVFHDDDSFLDGIERRATAFKHTPARRHGVADAVEMRFDHVVGNGPCTAMDDQNGIGRQEESSGKLLDRIAGGSEFSAHGRDRKQKPR